MESGLIDEFLLDKDIKQISFYAKEEKDKINSICIKMEKILENYLSINSKLLLNDIEVLKNNQKMISEKRVEYQEILNKVIIQYEGLVEETKRKFSGEL